MCRLYPTKNVAAMSIRGAWDGWTSVRGRSGLLIRLRRYGAQHFTKVRRPRHAAAGSLSDPFLERMSVIVLDEAQEDCPRCIDGPSEGTPPTAERSQVRRHVRDARCREVPTRSRGLHTKVRAGVPVEIFYTPEPERDYVEAAVRTAAQIHACESAGDIWFSSLR